MAYLSGAYFEVQLSGKDVTIEGAFTSVSGLNMEIEYDVFSEGGSNYPRFYFKQTKPQILTLEQGVVTDTDAVSTLMTSSSSGAAIPLSGTITLKDSFGNDQRQWIISDAYLQKYIGPTLDSNQPALAVNRMEFIYNGCC